MKKSAYDDHNNFNITNVDDVRNHRALPENSKNKSKQSSSARMELENGESKIHNEELENRKEPKPNWLVRGYRRISMALINLANEVRYRLNRLPLDPESSIRRSEEIVPPGFDNLPKFIIMGPQYVANPNCDKSMNVSPRHVADPNCNEWMNVRTSAVRAYVLSHALLVVDCRTFAKT